MHEQRIPRPTQAPRTWFSAGILAASLAGVVASLTGGHAAAAPAAPTAASSWSVAAVADTTRVQAVDVVAPQLVDITFATPVAPKPSPTATKVQARSTRSRVVPVVRRTTTSDSSCSGTGWQQRRGEKALASLLHPVPAGVTVSFLPSRGALKGKLVHVNLIPLNPTPGSEWDASPKPVEREFVRRLRAAGVNTTVRDTRGREIAGACGQLAAAD
jgi:hypothetical protein